jgi:hypothetical protein
LLHHQCGFPGAPSDPIQFNHYAFLQAVASIPSDANIIHNSGQNKPDFYDLFTGKKEGQHFDESGKKEDLTNSLTTLRSTLLTPAMEAQDGDHFSPRFTGTVSEQLKLTTSSHKGVKTVRKKATPRKHAKPSCNHNLTPSEIKLLIDRPSELAEALELAEMIAAEHVSLATASDRLNYLLQSKSQKTVISHNTGQDKSPEQVEVCANEDKMATPGYIGCAEATAMKKKRVDRMAEVAVHLKRKTRPQDVIKRVERSKNPVNESLKAVVSLFPTTAKEVGSPKNAKTAKTASQTNQNSKDKRTKQKLKANRECKGRTKTQRRAPQRITAIKSQVNRRTLKRVAQAVTERMWPLAPGAWPGLSQ